MNRKTVRKFLAEKCKNLDRRAKSLVGDVLSRLPDEFDVESLSEVFPLYAGSTYPLSGKGWVLLLEWDILIAPFEAKAKDAEQKKQVAMGVIALNLAHYALGHGPEIIHSEGAYSEARDLALRWGFSKEIQSVEKELL